MSRPLTFSPNDARAIVEYNHRAFDNFVRRIRRLPKNAATKRRGIGHETLFATLVHVLNVQEVWFVYILRGRASDAELEKLFRDTTRKPSTWKEFHVYSKRVWAGVDATARALTPRGLARRASVFWMPGTYTVRDGILQATFEEAHHLGEIIGALWQDDVGPLNMMWIPNRQDRRPRRR
jgi:uncharacterized damage-inducible protein DinB